jgi:hypothetical protein
MNLKNIFKKSDILGNFIYDEYICKNDFFEVINGQLLFERNKSYKTTYRQNSKLIGVDYKTNYNHYFQLERNVKGVKLQYFHDYFEKLTDQRKRKLKKIN